VAAVALLSPVAAHNEEREEAVGGQARLALRERERLAPRVVALSVLGLLRETHPVAGEPKAAIELLLAIMPSTVAPEEGEAVRDRLPVLMAVRPYMAAGPEQAAVGLPGPEELVASGVLILRAAAALLGPRTGTPAGLAEVMPSAAATAAGAAEGDRRMLTVGPAGPVVFRAGRAAVELRVGLVPGREVWVDWEAGEKLGCGVGEKSWLDMH
jgi:hypothetical protein